jgi:subtilisin family serine protease
MPRPAALLKLARVAVVAVCAIALVPLALRGQTPPAYRLDRILVKPNPGTDLAPLHAALHTRVLRTFPAIGNLQVLQLPGDLPVDDAIAAYQASGFVRYAERDFILHLLAEPNDFRYLNGDLWHLHNAGQYGGKPGADIKAIEAWDIQRTASDVVVAVIDTGIRLTHEDLAPNLWTNPGESGPGLLGLDRRQNLLDDDGNGFIDDVHGINAILGLGVPLDDYGHGSHVSGIIGAAGNNTVGVTGLAWQVQLMSIKAFDALGNAAMSDLVTSIDYACAKGARIINASWGDPSFTSTALYDAVDRARQAGVLFIAAAGNSNGDNDTLPLYPASYPLDNVIAVLATDRSDERAGWSNYGANTVHLGAPGAPVFSCWNGSDTDYRNFDGTSMAAPQVTGACALIWSREPGLTYQQVRARVLSTVDVLPSLQGKTITGGRLNVQRALAP